MSRLVESSVPTHASDFPCIELINSSFSDYLGSNRTVDRLPLEEWRQWLLERYGLTPRRPDPAPIDRLQALRNDLRAILGRWAEQGVVEERDARTLDGWISPATARERITVAAGRLESRLEPVSSDWTWTISRIGASAVQLIAKGEAQRLKVCSNPSCSWLYYDRTLNASKQYCSTNPCASLVRVRRFRRASRSTQDR
ncbi:MAG TPA: CGNR zinc finger domain-containing protein [Chloroflexota bacterium]|nr:CGNR zinc finger domain-containing protein [Chloroflexota bacterium]